MNVALHPDSLNLISICTGGGGLDLGVELAIPNARSVCLVEREAFAVSQLVSAMQQGLMAQAPVWSDARTFNGRAWRGAVDGLIGGIPCQPHSLAGKRLEREDPRDLWSTARRIIVQSGAWFVLIENVGGMLSSGGAERVWRDLGRLGFACEVGLFTAAEVGASHSRERTFIFAVADAGRSERRQRLARGHQLDRAEAGWIEGSSGAAEPSEVMADACDARPQGSEFGGSPGEWDGEETPGPTPELCGAFVEHAPRVGWREGRAEPSIWRGRRSAAGADGEVANTNVSGQQRHQRGAGAEQFAPERSIFPPGPDDISGWRHSLASTPELEPAFRRVADGLATRLDTARVDRLRMLGNGVVPLQAAYAVRTLATRLASSGSAGAARLVRLMEELS